MEQSWRIDDSEIKYISEVLRGGFPGRQDHSFVTALEKLFAEKFGVEYAISFTNGTATLHAALAACGIGPGDEVIVPPLTMSSTTLAVLHAGATPVFADVDPETFVLSPSTIKAKITSRTRAVMPVSLYGLPAVTPQVMQLAKQHNLFVIEDSAQCFFGRVGELMAGSIGDIGSFSFQNSKHMTCGEGGITITRAPEMAMKMRKFSSLGYGQLSAEPGKSKIDKKAIASPDTIRHTDYGFNYRLSELCAAVAFAQLEKLEHFVAMRQKCAAEFLDVISGCRWLKPQLTPEGIENSFWAVAMQLNTDFISWQDFFAEFINHGGDGFYGAWRLTYREPYFAGLFPEAKCPVAEILQPRMIQLKTNYGTDAEIGTQAMALKRTIEYFNLKKSRRTQACRKHMISAINANSL